MNNVTLQLTEEDAQLFKEFQKRYTFMKFLENTGFFTMKSGYVTVHFARSGEIHALDLVEKYQIVEKFSSFKVPL